MLFIHLPIWQENPRKYGLIRISSILQIIYLFYNRHVYSTFCIQYSQNELVHPHFESIIFFLHISACLFPLPKSLQCIWQLGKWEFVPNSESFFGGLESSSVCSPVSSSFSQRFFYFIVTSPTTYIDILRQKTV